MSAASFHQSPNTVVSPTTTDSCHRAEEEAVVTVPASGGRGGAAGVAVEAFWMNPSSPTFQASPTSFNRYLRSLRHHHNGGGGAMVDGDTTLPVHQGIDGMVGAYQQQQDVLRNAILSQLSGEGNNNNNGAGTRVGAADRFVCAGYGCEEDEDDTSAEKEAAALALVAKMSNSLIADAIAATVAASSFSSSSSCVATIANSAATLLVAPELGTKRPRAEEEEEAK